MSILSEKMLNFNPFFQIMVNLWKVLFWLENIKCTQNHIKFIEKPVGKIYTESHPKLFIFYIIHCLYKLFSR